MVEALVVCPNCKIGQEVPFDIKLDRPSRGFVCTRCQTKIT